MGHAASAAERHRALLDERLVKYEDLRPCTTAFIDTRTPGSQAKENFTIIGPGVAESPDQHVHVSLPHGFNIGGARQPPGCVNSQHSHETAEVFIVHSGTWSFVLGAQREDGEVRLGPGDTISIPTRVFRGFENVGDDVGFMFAVLGGDDPGRVTWAPYVFDQARKHGLVLLENGQLIDTTRGEQVPPDAHVMPPTTAADVAALDRLSADDLAACVVRAGELGAACEGLVRGLREYPLIGAALAAQAVDAGRMSWPHGFQVRAVSVAPGARTPVHRRHEEEVLLMHEGRLIVSLPDGELELRGGDVFTVPIGLERRFENRHESDALAFVVRGGDTPQSPEILAES